MIRLFITTMSQAICIQVMDIHTTDIRTANMDIRTVDKAATRTTMVRFKQIVKIF